VLRLVGLWTEPADIDSFEREYLGAHFPKLHRLPGATNTRTSRCLDGPYFRMTEVTFDALGAIHDALATDVGKQILTDARALSEKFGVKLDVLVVSEAT
jgi:uncharacterized protein (TIGR02118 family)